MKPLEILSSIPQWANASPEDLLASPAWLMACRMGNDVCAMKLASIRPLDTIDLSVSFEDESHVLRIANSPRLKELGAIWSSLADVPEPIILALVEKECAPLFQLLENAVRKQFKVAGLVKSDDAIVVTDEICADIYENGQVTLSFALSRSPAVVSALGNMRNIDVSHASVREITLPSEVQYASFALQSGETGSMAEGDAILMPEIGSVSPSIVVDGRFIVSEGGVQHWNDDGLLRVLAAETSSISLGELFDGAPHLPGVPAEAAQLRLVKSGKVVSTGRFGYVGKHPAFICENPGIMD